MGVVQHSWSWPIWPSNQKESGWPEDKFSSNFSYLRCLRKIFISFQITELEFVLDIPSCLLFSQVKNISSLFFLDSGLLAVKAATQFSATSFDTSDSLFCETSVSP